MPTTISDSKALDLWNEYAADTHGELDKMPDEAEKDGIALIRAVYDAGYLAAAVALKPLDPLADLTPPAEVVDLPSERPAHLTDVEDVGGDVCAYMALDRDGDWVGVDQGGYFRVCRPTMLDAFTLPDGTRARRDGNCEDGRPRFVKVREGEK